MSKRFANVTNVSQSNRATRSVCGSLECSIIATHMCHSVLWPITAVSARAKQLSVYAICLRTRWRESRPLYHSSQFETSVESVYFKHQAFILTSAFRRTNVQREIVLTKIESFYRINPLISVENVYNSV